jgi:Ca2+-binding RTX toxin-like protein
VSQETKRSRTRGGVLAGAAVAALLAFPGIASAAVTSSVTGGVLSVSSDAGDAITITCVGGNVKVNGADPGSGAAACNALTGINVDGGPGANAIDLTGVTSAAFPNVASVLADGNAGNDTILGSERPDRLIGGDNDDTTEGRAGDDTLVWNPGDDSDINVGGPGSDTIEVNGGGGNERFSANPAAAGGGVRFERSADSAGGFFSLDITTAERLDMNANGGDDSFTSEGAIAALGFALDVDGGAGNDTLDGGDGPDLIDGGADNDRIVGDDNPLGTRDDSRGGAGDDTLVWNPGDDDDVNEGGDGNDTAEVNGAGGDEKFDVRPSTIAGRVQFDRTDPAPFNIDIGTTENLRVNAAGGDDRIRGFKRLAGLIASTFNGDDGNDRIRGTDGEDLLGGGKGHDLIKSIDKAADTVECDAGIDVALVDRRDQVRGCELVLGGLPRVALVGKPELDGNRVALRLRCVASERCKGKVKLRRAGKLLGAKKFHIAHGDADTVRVKLNRRGGNLVANGSSVRVTLRIVAHDKHGNGWRTATRVKLAP